MVLGDPPAAAKAGPADKESALAVAIYPLATPIIAGPGAMLAIILLTDNNRFTFAEQAETAAVLAVVLTILLGAFLLGDVIRKAIGQGGTNVIRRIMGVILAALSVNMLGNALADWLPLPPL